MKEKRKYFLVVAVIFLGVAGAAIYQNCGGTQTRSTDFSILSVQAEAYLAEVQCAVNGSSSVQPSTVTAVNNVSTIVNSDQGELFYTQAPSAMGDINLVAPLNYSTMRTDGGNQPQQIYGFFALGADGSGSLVIALSDSGTTATSTPVATAAPQTLFASKLSSKITRGKSLTFEAAHQLDATSTSPSCTSSNPLNLTTAITAYNDGTLGLEPASFDGDIFEIELTPDGTTVYRVRSYDVEDGSLQDTIQLEVNEVDPNSGQEIYLGDINLTQPD